MNLSELMRKPTRSERIREHFDDYKPVYIIGLILVILLGIFFGYEYMYPCVYGHDEEQWVDTWTVDGNGNMTLAGGSYQDVFICDCRTVRDSIK
jgi:hypothetical protein